MRDYFVRLFTQPAMEQTPLDQFAIACIVLAALLLAFIVFCVACEFTERWRRR